MARMRSTFLSLLSATAVLAFPCQSCNKNRMTEARVGSTTIVEVLPSGIFPNLVHALVGDNIWFKFGDGFNSVIQGDYESPCRSLENGFSSGTIWNSDVETYFPEAYVIKITENKPIWYYNGEGDKCRNLAHVAVINPPANGAQNLHSYIERTRQPGTTDWQNRKGGFIVRLGREACQRVPR